MNNGNNSGNNGWNNTGFTPDNSPNDGSQLQNVTYITEQAPSSNGPIRKRKSPLSIIAFVFSFTFILSFVGIILGIIDLVKNDREKSHGLSKAAIAIGGAFTALLIMSRLNLFSNNQTNNQTKITDTVNNGSNSSSNGGSNTSKSGNNGTDSTKTKTPTKQEYMNSCKEVVYKEVERRPNSFKGENVKFYGKVVQVSEGLLNSVTLRVATSIDGYIDEDIWYVTYKTSDDEDRLLEDDYVTVYGECDGVTSYTTVLGAQVTIPSVKAKYITIDEKAVVKPSEPEYDMKTLTFEIIPDKYSDSGYKYRAIVEVVNKGDSNIYLDDASFDIEDSSKHLIQSDDYIGVFPNVVKPGEKGYLYTDYPEELKSVDSLDDLVLVPNFTAKATTATPNEYEVSDISLYQDKYSMSVTGRVTNNYSADDSLVIVGVIFYDVNGNVIGIDDTYVSDLPAGKTERFDMSVTTTWDITVDDVANYSVICIARYYGF